METAGWFGISADRVADYVPDEEGTAMNFAMMSEAVAGFRKCRAIPSETLEAIRTDKKKRGEKK